MTRTQWAWIVAVGLGSTSAWGQVAAPPPKGGEVFTVGERSATADIRTEVQPTHVELPTDAMTERGRRELMRDLVGEQGFAFRMLPLGASLTLEANGTITPGAAEYKRLIYEKGSAAGPGDRVAITAIEIKGNHLIVDVNGGPYVKHRFLRHISLNGAQPAMVTDGAVATGSRITLVFEGGMPEVSPPEVKALLAPVIDFGVKRSEVAYAETLPAPLKNAIAAHEVMVGMNRQMVLASLGAPESKVREQANGKKYEEWIYGHLPQTIKFVRFQGDRVSLVKVAAVGKPIELHEAEELPGLLPAAPAERVLVAGDEGVEGRKAGAAPTLLKPGEAAEVGSSQRKVRLPVDSSGQTGGQSGQNGGQTGPAQGGAVNPGGVSAGSPPAAGGTGSGAGDAGIGAEPVHQPPVVSSPPGD